MRRHRSRSSAWRLAATGNTQQIDAGGRAGLWSTFASVERHDVDSFDLTPTIFDTTGAQLRRTDAMGKARGQLSDSFSLGLPANGYINRSSGRSTGELGPESDLVKDRAQNYSATATWLATPRVTVDARGYHGRYAEDSTGALASGAALASGTLREQFSKADATAGIILDSRQFLQAGVEWTQDQHRLGIGSRATVTSGVRYDRHSMFGDAISPKRAGQVRITEEVRARASYGRGFRAPDLGQHYYRFLNPTNLYQVLGNPALRPEHANSWQTGVDYAPRTQRFRVGVQEGIDPAFRPQLGRLVFIYKNIADVKTQGVETDGVVPLLLSFGGIEAGIRKRLDGPDYVMSDTALLPDPRIARWIVESARSTMRVTKGDAQ